ncbi:MAG: hypothetical protein AAGC57_09555 [Pseudomonadota bacterium]
MELALYSVHVHPRAGHIETVGEPPKIAFLPPLWALYEGLWLTLAVLVALYAATVVFVPLALSAVVFGTVLICGFDGGTLQRVELRLRGWREVATVEAASHEAAEELYVTGRAAVPGRGASA